MIAFDKFYLASIINKIYYAISEEYRRIIFEQWSKLPYSLQTENDIISTDLNFPFLMD